jgi:hypothetical protein
MQSKREKSIRNRKQESREPNIGIEKCKVQIKKKETGNRINDSKKYKRKTH